ncbi:MAG: hypothetical protein QM296_06920 [Bacillota bacterium]|nr:hypothetical protein [Bacillota bacterium]
MTFVHLLFLVLARSFLPHHESVLFTLIFRPLCYLHFGVSLAFDHVLTIMTHKKQEEKQDQSAGWIPGVTHLTGRIPLQIHCLPA